MCLSQSFLPPSVQESMVRYTSPVNPSVYPHLAVTLLGIGLFFMAWFFVYPHVMITCASCRARATL